MSLINDALKRAKDFQKPATSIPPPEPMFVESQTTAKGPEWMIPVLLCTLAAAAALSIGLAFLIFERKPAPQLTTAAAVQPVTTPKPSSPPSISSSSSLTAPKPSEGGSTNPAQPDFQPTKSEPPPPPPPPLRVQGISYSNAKWQAIVNGTTVYVGDTVNGFRVAKISKDNVSFIAPGGSQKILALGAQ